MISLELARALREAGLGWQPREGDCFVLPGRDMDGQIFVLSALPALIQLYNGYPVVTFQASAEWALDYVMLGEALWLPSESQLRGRLADLLGPEASLRLERGGAGYRCVAGLAEGPRSFEAPEAEEAYGAALLAALRDGSAARN